MSDNECLQKEQKRKEEMPERCEGESLQLKNWRMGGIPTDNRVPDVAQKGVSQAD